MSDSAGLVINLKGTDGTGIFANTKDGAVVKSGASVNVIQADGGSALVVNNAASEVVQSGNLISASLSHAVVDASKHNPLPIKVRLKLRPPPGLQWRLMTP